ncbi:hypothetical protein Efla_004886 [Eimeria flavescens]
MPSSRALLTGGQLFATFPPTFLFLLNLPCESPCWVAARHSQSRRCCGHPEIIFWVYAQGGAFGSFCRSACEAKRSEGIMRLQGGRRLLAVGSLGFLLLLYGEAVGSAASRAGAGGNLLSPEGSISALQTKATEGGDDGEQAEEDSALTEDACEAQAAVASVMEGDLKRLKDSSSPWVRFLGKMTEVKDSKQVCMQPRGSEALCTLPAAAEGSKQPPHLQCGGDEYMQLISSYIRTKNCVLSLAVTQTLTQSWLGHTGDSGIFQRLTTQYEKAMEYPNLDSPLYYLYQDAAQLVKEVMQSAKDGLAAFHSPEIKEVLQKRRRELIGLLCALGRGSEVDFGSNVIVSDKMVVIRGSFEESESEALGAFKDSVDAFGVFVRALLEEGGFLDRATVIHDTLHRIRFSKLNALFDSVVPPATEGDDSLSVMKIIPVKQGGGGKAHKRKEQQQGSDAEQQQQTSFLETALQEEPAVFPVAAGQTLPPTAAVVFPQQQQLQLQQMAQPAAAAAAPAATTPVPAAAVAAPAAAVAAPAAAAAPAAYASPAQAAYAPPAPAAPAPAAYAPPAPAAPAPAASAPAPAAPAPAPAAPAAAPAAPAPAMPTVPPAAAAAPSETAVFGGESKAPAEGPFSNEAPADAGARAGAATIATAGGAAAAGEGAAAGAASAEASHPPPPPSSSSSYREEHKGVPIRQRIFNMATKLRMFEVSEGQLTYFGDVAALDKTVKAGYTDITDKIFVVWAQILPQAFAVTTFKFLSLLLPNPSVDFAEFYNCTMKEDGSVEEGFLGEPPVNHKLLVERFSAAVDDAYKSTWRRFFQAADELNLDSRNQQQQQELQQQGVAVSALELEPGMVKPHSFVSSPEDSEEYNLAIVSSSDGLSLDGLAQYVDQTAANAQTVEALASAGHSAGPTAFGLLGAAALFVATSLFV